MSKKKKPTAKRAKLPPVGTQWRLTSVPNNTDFWWEMMPSGDIWYFEDGTKSQRSSCYTPRKIDKDPDVTRFHSTYRKPEPEKLRHETTSTAAGWLPDPAQIDRVLRMMDDLTRRVQALEGGKR